MAQNMNQANIQYLPQWRAMGETGDLPVGWAPSSSSASSSSGGGNASAAMDPVAAAQKLRQFNIESNAPAISSLQAQIPEVQQKFQTEQNRLLAEKQPLQDRYKALLDEINRKETADISNVQRRTGQEFGARGIPASSTLYTDELIRAESPIRQAYSGQAKDVGLGQEEGLRGIDNLVASLAGQSVEAERTVKNAIGQLQSGDPASAIQGAMQILSLQQNQAQFQADQGIKQQQLNLQGRELAIKEQPKKYETLSEGSTIYDLLNGKALYTAPKTYKDLQGQSGGNDYYSSTSSNTSAGRYSFVN